MQKKNTTKEQEQDDADDKKWVHNANLCHSSESVGKNVCSQKIGEKLKWNKKKKAERHSQETCGDEKCGSKIYNKSGWWNGNLYGKFWITLSISYGVSTHI